MDYQKEQVTMGLIEEIFPLLEAHASELNTSGAPLDADLSRYVKADRLGGLAVYTVRDHEVLIGYAIYWIQRHPHYEIKVAHQDILYVSEDYRKGRVGIKLIKLSEKLLKEDHGCDMVLQSTKHLKDLSSLFEYLGYEELEKVYSKKL